MKTSHSLDMVCRRVALAPYSEAYQQLQIPVLRIWPVPIQNRVGQLVRWTQRGRWQAKCHGATRLLDVGSVLRSQVVHSTTIAARELEIRARRKQFHQRTPLPRASENPVVGVGRVGRDWDRYYRQQPENSRLNQ